MAFLFLLSLSGCQTENFFRADSLPDSLRLVAHSNPQESNLTGFAHTTGGSDTIGPGDLLEITISASLSKDDQVTIPARIQDDGTAVIPDIGTVHLGGYEPQAAESLLRMEAINKGLFLNPTVTVAFEHKKVNRVRVLGAVNRPGVYELAPNSSDIVSAIAAAEGLAENAGDNVDVRNPMNARGGSANRPQTGPNSAISPYSAVSATAEVEDGMRAFSVSLTSASKSTHQKYMIEDGGVVMVEKRDPAPIQVGGLVNNADTYDFPLGKPLTVVGAIQMAGGPSNQLADKVFVIRPLAQQGKKALIQVSLRRAKRIPKEDLLLGPGDMVLVEHTPATVMMEAMQLIRFGVSGTTPLF